ncbi:MAG: EamA family transporter RarD [Actinomycetaceae bacterium]|nr:EamA family transporter RarD [Actinomycetaceae bacterium]
MTPSSTASTPSPRLSLTLGLGCYIIWGFFPLYFIQLSPAGSLEVIVHRAVWGLISCLIFLTILGRLPELKALIRNKKAILYLSISGILIVLNWTFYVFAIQSGRTLDAALGYYINPLMTVAVGMIILRERISFFQKIALFFGAAAVVVMVVGMGSLPWISLILPTSFTLYSLAKKQVAKMAGAIEGMTIETAAVTPILLGYYAYLALNEATSFHTINATNTHTSWPIHLLWLIGSGFLTVLCLCLFAQASKGLSLGVLGFIQYVGPSLQMIIAVLIFHEHVEPGRWVATALVWVALFFLTAEWALKALRARRKYADQQ